MRTCSKCKHAGPDSDFYAKHSWCRQCKRADMVERSTKDPLNKKNIMLKTIYGIDMNEWNRMFEAQGGVCKICSKPETRTIRGKPSHLAVDHCHTTGKIRGLLCCACNTAIGYLNECPTIIESAAKYIKESV